jgi:lipopolysaccharide transport system ATP-binding protein
VKHYSSGMFVRLGFAVAIHCEPDILLVDEVLAVGDISFQAKCTAKLKELDKQGVTKIFVSHNLNSVLILCNKSIYLSNGKIQHYGQTIDVINEYKKDVMLQKDDSNRNDQIRYGTKDIEITKVSFLDKTYTPKSIFRRGEPFLIKMEYITQKLITNPEFVIGFYTEDGSLISKPNTRDHNISIDTAQGEGQITYFVESLPFNVGKYLVTVAVWDSFGQVAYDHHEKLYEFIVEDGLIDNKIHERFGYLYIPAQWVVNNALEHPKCNRD